MRINLKLCASAFLTVAGLVGFTMGADNILKPGDAPAHSTSLFDGGNESSWVVFGSKDPADWPIEKEVMVSAKHDIATKAKFKDFQLHVEFNEPSLGPEFKDQDRGNSGVYLQGRYELQVLDSYNNETDPKGVCGAIYGVKAPLKNMAKKPGEWQTYDITFHAAKFEEGKKVKNAHVTVYWNGELVQDETEIPKETGGGAKETADGGPIRLQFHHHSVKFRNIWISAIKG
jgi:hypothetical protein